MMQEGTVLSAEQPTETITASTIRATSRQAYQPAIRNVLVIGEGRLEPTVERTLRGGGWIPLFGGTHEEAAALCQQFPILTGLAICSQPLGDDEFRRISRSIHGLRTLQWLAVISREDLARSDMRRLIVDRVRDYQLYPVDAKRLTVSLGHAWGIAALADAERRADDHPGGRFGLVGTSPPMLRVYEQIERVANAGMPVLITGETGTGKELVARAIHAQSHRAAEPFVAVNCAAIPSSLIQSELFGAVKGAFTDAKTDNDGLIRSADGGTLLLDEIGELPLQSQASLLRFLEDREVTPLGGRMSVQVDVAIIASTNRNLRAEARQGRFRADLLYRLDVLAVETPPLRERVPDIESLAKHFLRVVLDKQTLPGAVHGFTEDALDWLRAQSWPGNLRELRSCVIQAAMHCRGDRIAASDLRRLRPGERNPTESLSDAVNNTEKVTLERLLKSNGGNVSKTARDLQISRMTLYRMMAKHGIERC